MTKAWYEKPMEIPIQSPVRRKLNLSSFDTPASVELVKGLGAKKASLSKVDVDKKPGELDEKLFKKDQLPSEDDEKLDKAGSTPADKIDLKDEINKLEALTKKGPKSDDKSSMDKALDILKSVGAKKVGGDIRRVGSGVVTQEGTQRGGVGARGGVIDHITSSGNVVYKKRFNNYYKHHSDKQQYHKEKADTADNDDDKRFHDMLDEYHQAMAQAESEGDTDRALEIGKRAQALQEHATKKKNAREESKSNKKKN